MRCYIWPDKDRQYLIDHHKRFSPTELCCRINFIFGRHLTTKSIIKEMDALGLGPIGPEAKKEAGIPPRKRSPDYLSPHKIMSEMTVKGIRWQALTMMLGIDRLTYLEYLWYGVDGRNARRLMDAISKLAKRRAA